MYHHPSLSFDAGASPWQPVAADSKPVLRLHIFRAGLHTSGNGVTRTYTTDELSAMALAYDPVRSGAPLVVGHPEDNSPAYGWVSRLFVEGDDLFAEVDTIDPLLADAIRVGMYRKISASIYLPESPANPLPGVLYLRHVGLLGGAAPAVKGLAPVTLAEGDGVAVFEEVCRNQSVQGVPAMSEPNPELAELKAQLTAIEAQNASLKAAADAAQKALADQQLAATHAEHLAFAQSLAKEGRLTPSMVPVMVATLNHLVAGPGDFSEGGKTKPLALAFREALSALPVVIPMGEAAGDHSEGSPARPIGQMSGHEAAALFLRDPQAFRRAAGLTE